MSNETLNQIVNMLGKLTGEVDKLTGKVDKLTGEVHGVKQEQVKTNERLLSIESKQHIIYEQTGELSEYHSETMSHFENLATKGDLEYFDKKITELG